MFFYNDGKNEVGPFDEVTTRRLLDTGIISPNTLLREEGAQKWLPARHLLEGSGDTYARRSGNETANGAEKFDPQSLVGPNVSRDDTTDATLARDLEEVYADRSGNRPLVSAAGWLATPATPWRRYGARMLDTSLNGSFGFLIFSVALYAIAPATADSFFQMIGGEFGFALDVIITGFFASLVGGALIGVSGFTLGKWIFGVKVTRIDSNRIGFTDGIRRDLEVYAKGLGLGIPIVALVTMWLSYQKLNGSGKTSWDEGRYIVWHRPSGAAQYVLNVIGILLIFIVIGSLQALSKM
jgi:uncharacterized RDD family membrane protein YckC